MAYFNNFNYLLYPNFQSAGDYLIVKNITERIVRQLSSIDDQVIYYDYTMIESETLESVAAKLYGTTDYYWTIMVINNIFDRFYGFPLSTQQFNDYIVNKYGSIPSAQEEYKYYIRPSQYATSTDKATDLSYFIEVPYNYYSNYPASLNSVTMKYSTDMYSWELSQNESKRTFKVLQKQYLNSFVKLFNSLASA